MSRYSPDSTCTQMCMLICTYESSIFLSCYCEQDAVVTTEGLSEDQNLIML